MSRFLLVAASLFLLGAAQTAIAADGKALYQATCVACHGAKGEGAFAAVPDLAKGGRLSKPDAELEAHIFDGFQSKGSSMAMPPKGGNPNLTREDVKSLVVYMRALTGTAALPAPTVGSAPTPAASAPVAGAASAPAASAPLAGAASAPITTPATAPPSDMAAFGRGAKAWADNCGRCHSMHDPKDFSDRQWKVITTHMRLRAGLDGKQVRDITVFLQGSN